MVCDVGVLNPLCAVGYAFDVQQVSETGGCKSVWGTECEDEDAYRVFQVLGDQALWGKLLGMS